MATVVAVRAFSGTTRKQQWSLIGRPHRGDSSARGKNDSAKHASPSRKTPTNMEEETKRRGGRTFERWIAIRRYGNSAMSSGTIENRSPSNP